MKTTEMKIGLSISSGILLLMSFILPFTRTFDRVMFLLITIAFFIFALCLKNEIANKKIMTFFKVITIDLQIIALFIVIYGLLKSFGIWMPDVRTLLLLLGATTLMIYYCLRLGKEGMRGKGNGKINAFERALALLGVIFLGSSIIVDIKEIFDMSTKLGLVFVGTIFVILLVAVSIAFLVVHVINKK